MRERVLAALRRIGWPTRAIGDHQRILRPVTSGRGVTRIEVVIHRQRAVEPVGVEHDRIVVGPPQREPEGFYRDNAHALASGYYRGLLDGLGQEAGPWGYSIATRSSRDLRDPALAASLDHGEVAGVVLTGEWSPDLAGFIARRSRPLVLIDVPSSGTVPTVCVDDQTGIDLVMDHLLGLGHRRIAYAGAPVAEVGVADWTYRPRAWRLRMAEAGLPWPSAWFNQGSGHMAEVRTWATALLTASDRPTAVVCQNDFAAVAVVEAARALGLVLPRDLSVAGYDDGEIARTLDPPLTSVAVPNAAIGRVALHELLLEISDAADAPRIPRRVLVAPALVVRRSTGRLR